MEDGNIFYNVYIIIYILKLYIVSCGNVITNDSFVGWGLYNNNVSALLALKSSGCELMLYCLWKLSFIQKNILRVTSTVAMQNNEGWELCGRVKYNEIFIYRALIMYGTYLLIYKPQQIDKNGLHHSLFLIVAIHFSQQKEGDGVERKIFK